MIKYGSVYVGKYLHLNSKALIDYPLAFKLPYEDNVNNAGYYRAETHIYPLSLLNLFSRITFVTNIQAKIIETWEHNRDIVR